MRRQVVETEKKTSEEGEGRGGIQTKASTDIVRQKFARSCC